jgi:acid phosphatase (class A)
MSETRRIRVRGYLPFNSLPKVQEIIPPPPEDGSAALAHDIEVSKKNLALHGTPRWQLATRDANELADAYSCLLHIPITEADTPRLSMLLRRVSTDAGLTTFQAKNKYKRPRPFMVNNEPVCTPEVQEGLRGNGSYPSGHTAYGWASALVLVEIAPDYTDAILARGREFGKSRIVCNVHWQSDVVEGRFVGAAVVARLHAEPEFRADLEAAKAEIKAVRSKHLKPACDCSLEEKAEAN